MGTSIHNLLVRNQVHRSLTVETRALLLADRDVRFTNLSVRIAQGADLVGYMEHIQNKKKDLLLTSREPTAERVFQKVWNNAATNKHQTERRKQTEIIYD